MLLRRQAFLCLYLLFLSFAYCQGNNPPANPKEMAQLPQSEAEWKKKLSPERYHILREKGTEPPFSGALYYHKANGTYHCAGCGSLLFYSTAKYDSGTGWPSFFEPAAPGVIAEHLDTSYGMVRTEITCARCGGHLGHLFPDGPQPTGLRYCVNSLALEFKPAESSKDKETKKTKETKK